MTIQRSDNEYFDQHTINHQTNPELCKANSHGKNISKNQTN
jgi:hypothetical protein